MAKSRKKLDYDNKYIKEHYKHYYLRLSYEKDQELMAYVDQLENKNRYIKNLISEDMKKTQQ